VLLRLPLLLPESTDEAPTPSKSGKVLLALDIANRLVAKCASIVLIDTSNKSFRVLGRTTGSVISLQRGVSYIAVARVFCQSMPLPDFSYRLVTISSSPLAAPKFESFELPSLRFKGFYSPNNKLRLFRDKITIDKNHFPLALKVSVSGLMDSPDSENALPIDQLPDDRIMADSDSLAQNTCFSLKFYRKVDKYMFREVRSRGNVQVYDITIDEISRDLPEGVSLVTASAAGAAASGGKDGKKDAKKELKEVLGTQQQEFKGLYLRQLLLAKRLSSW
jgi:hypothetical protein